MTSVPKGIPWHSIEKELDPNDRMIRELFLMARVIERDWLFDDVTSKQNTELTKIAKSLRHTAKRLKKVDNGQ